MAETSPDLEQELTTLEAELKRLEAEYRMFFAGRLPRPPWETRSRVENMVRRLDRLHISNYGLRFRFTTLQARLARFSDVWDRGLRAREEGRPGPFAQPQRPAGPAAKKPEDRVVHVTSLSDPGRETEKLRQLYESVAEARREAGQDAIPFTKFAHLVRTQVAGLKAKGGAEVTFRVAVKDGKVNFTARPVKGGRGKE